MTKENHKEEQEEEEVVPTTKLVFNQVFKANVRDLKTHPIAKGIYDYKINKDTKFLARLIELVGQLEPVLINSNNEILSGNRRWQAIKYLGRESIDAIRIEASKNEEDNIVFHNQHRKKKLHEILKEAEALLGLLKPNQGQRRDLLGDDITKFGKIGQDRFEIAGKAVGLSASSLRRLMAVVDFERESEENKKLGLVNNIISGQMKAKPAHDMMKAIIAERVEREARKEIKIHAVKKEDFKIYNSSSEKMKEVKPDSIQIVFTSPPYYNLRNYGNSVKGKLELGMETSPQEYVENLSKHLGDVHKVLKKTGSFFLNIGDTYHKKENLLISTRVLLELCKDRKWFLVNEIIWRKTNSIPQTTDKRLQPTYEKIFHLVKDPESYYYKPFKRWNDNDFKIIRAPQDRDVKTGKKSEPGYTFSRPYQKLKDFIDEQTVKDIITGTNAGARQTELKKTDRTKEHPAVMPNYLPVIPILTTSMEGDIILDPFSGSGTTGRAALMLGRKYVGYELNKDSYDLSKDDLANAVEEVLEADIQNLQTLSLDNL